MALMSSYLMTTKGLETFFNSLTTAQAPSTFTLKFLESLEFKSTNDRLYIGVLKGLGFLDANGTPTKRYFRFLDQTESRRVLAEAIRDAYSDLFAVNIKANELSTKDVKNKLKTLTQGKPSEKVLTLMANTFAALVAYADWSTSSENQQQPADSNNDVELPDQHGDAGIASDDSAAKTTVGDRHRTELHYNIQIHLPESRDGAVYDALFMSLRKHLL